MIDQAYDDIALERIVAERFGLAANISQVIARDVDVSRMAHATVFMTSKKQLLVYVTGPSRLTLGEVQKIVTRMGLKAEMYFPPKHQPEYFDTVGRDKFREIFPGRSQIDENDIRYYRTLTPYNPALVLISEVRDGHVYQYDSDASGDWRVAAKFAYRRIKTS